jgi:hypothetical protein
LLLPFGLLALGALGLAGLAAEEGKPSMTVIVERGEILAGQAIGLHLWIENPTGARMTDIRVRYAGPDFLAIGTVDPQGVCRTDDDGSIAVGAQPEEPVKQGGAVRLAPLGPGAVLDPPARLCLQANSKVEERDLSVGFGVAYRLEKDGQAVPGVLIVEKELSVGLFGTGSVGGVSLRLAAFIVPGLLFMMILRLGGLPLVGNLSATEVATLSVLVSVLLFLATDLIPQIDSTFAGIGSAVSAAQFLILCAAAIVIGGLLVLIHLAIKAAKARKQESLSRAQEALLVKDADDDATVFDKALKGAGDDFRPWIVRTRNPATGVEETFAGSLTAPRSGGGVVLLGWFELRPPLSGLLRNQLDQLVGSNRFSEALALGRKNGLMLEPRNPVNRLPANRAAPELTPDQVRRFPASDVLESSHEDVPAFKDDRPLGLGNP